MISSLRSFNSNISLWRIGIWLLCLTYTINSVDEGIVTAVAHGQPMAAKEDYVDVSVAAKKM